MIDVGDYDGQSQTCQDGCFLFDVVFHYASTKLYEMRVSNYLEISIGIVLLLCRRPIHIVFTTLLGDE